MRCEHCGVCLSKKVCLVHQSNCPEQYKELITEANEITLEKATKTDLIVYIMSERDKYKEIKLKQFKKADLYQLALEIKNGG